MRLPPFSAAPLAALLFMSVLMADARESEEKPVAKPVAKPIATAEGEPATEAPTVTTAEPVTTTGQAPTGEPAITTGPLSGVELVPGVKMVRPSEEDITTDRDPDFVNRAKADKDKDGKLTRKELALQDHREKLKTYDLNNDKKISKAEWKAANKEKRERDEKFFLVDKDEDGEIDEDEAVRFLLERISLNSTYVDTTGDEIKDVNQLEIKDNAPSEVRVTLFSIPFGK